MIKNIVQILIQNAETNGSKPAIIYKDQQITFSQLVDDIKKTAHCLKNRGIQKGDRVLIFVPMSISLYTILLALLYLGSTAVFLDAWADKKRLKQALEIAECKAFIGPIKAHFLRLFSKSMRKIPIKIISGINNLKEEIDNNLECQMVETNKPALITFTTGSTGIPKAANRTHEFLINQHQVLSHHLGLAENDIDMPTLPIFVLNNLAGSITSFIPSIDPGNPDKFDPSKVIIEMERYGITSTVGSPIFYDRLADYCIDKKIQPQSLSKIFTGGAPVFPRLADKLNQAFPDTSIEIVYGSTEAEPISTIKAEDVSLCINDKWNSGIPVGFPIKEIEIEIIKIIDGPINIADEKQFRKICHAKNEIGEICVTGKHVLKEYYRSEQAQKRNKISFNGKIWHRTGDLGYLDESNSLFLMGRMTTNITIANKEFYTFPLENALLNIPTVNIGTLIKIDTQVNFIIELKERTQSAKKETIKAIKNLELPYDSILFLKKIPRDPRHNSKIDYDKLEHILIKM